MKSRRVFGQLARGCCGWNWAVAMAGGAVLLLSGCQSSIQPASAPAPAFEEEVFLGGGTAPGAATTGVRSGDGAVSRSSMDRVLNAPSEARKSYSKPVEQRPGLGTGWGQTVRSDMGYTSFARGASKPYGGVATIYYNDKEGVEAMTSWKYTGKGMQTAASGLVEWGVKGRFGSLKNYHSSGRRFVVGKHGSRYSLLVKNLAKSRLEIVLSVDGLDVLDGKTASMKKRGYIIAPGQTLEVKGWRTSSSEVASFQFSSVAGSYAHLGSGNTRNVGVIGMAVFTEKGVSPFTWMPDEVNKRSAASPFAEAPLRKAR